MTVNELIFKLQLLRQDLKELPVVIIAPNGLEMEPEIKIHRAGKATILDPPEKMVITFDKFA